MRHFALRQILDIRDHDKVRCLNMVMGNKKCNRIRGTDAWGKVGQAVTDTSATANAHAQMKLGSRQQRTEVRDALAKQATSPSEWGKSTARIYSCVAV